LVGTLLAYNKPKGARSPVHGKSLVCSCNVLIYALHDWVDENLKSNLVQRGDYGLD